MPSAILSSGSLSVFGLPSAVVRLVLAAGMLALVWMALSVATRRDALRGDPWGRRLFGVATPESLAAIRVVVVGIVVMMVLREDLPSTAKLPASMLDVAERSFLSRLSARDAYRAFLGSATALTAFRAGLLVALAAALVGFRTRVTLPIAAAGYLLYGGILRQYTHFFHQGLLPLYVLAVLSVTPCADAWSVDRRLRERRGLPVPPMGAPTRGYGFARWAVYAVIGLCYFSSALAKVHVGGPLWWASVNQRTKLLSFAIEARLGLSLGLRMGHLPAWVFAALGIAALLFEGGMISVLWSRRARLLFAPVIVCFHLGVVLIYQIVFPDLLVLPLVLCQPQHLARAARALFRDRAEARRHLRAVLDESGFSRAKEPDRPAESVRSGPFPRRARARLLYAIAAYLPVMALMIESYPFTSWPMLSDRVLNPQLTYMRVLERWADGSTHPTDPAEDVAAMRDHRYYDVLSEHFERSDAAAKGRVDDFFHAVVKLHNARVPAERKIVSIVVENRRWNWEVEPDDPEKGPLLQVYRLDME